MKKIYILLCLVAILLSISVVSASENISDSNVSLEAQDMDEMNLDVAGGDVKSEVQDNPDKLLESNSTEDNEVKKFKFHQMQ